MAVIIIDFIAAQDIVIYNSSLWKLMSDHLSVKWQELKLLKCHTYSNTTNEDITYHMDLRHPTVLLAFGIIF